MVGFVMFVGVAEYALHDNSSDGVLWWVILDVSRSEDESAKEQGAKKVCLVCEESRGSVDVMGAQEEKEKERKGKKGMHCMSVCPWRATVCFAMISLHCIALINRGDCL